MNVAAIAVVTGAALALAAAPPPQASPEVTVRVSDDGAYVVTAQFEVPGPPSVAWAVLTDYENIRRFMPDVRTSEIVERGEDYVRVEQEAVSEYRLFSKRIYLTLDIREEPGVIRFVDRSHRSFERYEGAWHLNALGTRTEIRYVLTAKPAFAVPGTLLRPLLEGNAQARIDALRAEIAARALG